MIIITAPAKSLDFTTPSKATISSTPECIRETNNLAYLLQSYTLSQLKHILNVSNSLTQINFDRYAHFQSEPSEDITRPAIHAYKGDVFKQLTPHIYTEKQQEYAQTSLRIISALYGILRPYDQIQAYRLEMKTRLADTNITDLSKFWRQRVTQIINNELQKHKEKIIIDLTSNEYATAIDFASIDGQVVKIHFKQEKNHKINNFSLLTKRARGMLIQFLISHEHETIAGVMKFNDQNYKLTQQSEQSLTFTTKI